MTSNPRLSIVRSRLGTGLRAIYNISSFGYPSYATASLGDRVYTGLDSAQRPPSTIPMEPASDVQELRTPIEHLCSGIAPLPTQSQAALQRLEALWLLTEDRHRLLDASLIEPLAHQASIVDHIVRCPELKRVLIADEVGLGKTIEAGLIIKELIASSGESTPRVLYLAPAKLVDNVAEELSKLGLRPRRWSADAQEAMIGVGDTDPLVVASIHRAVVRNNSKNSESHYDKFVNSGPWDMVIVDEAHHLSDWSDDGNDPGLRMRLVREIINNRLVPGGRVLLMTATPHQGHSARFLNLLRLLSADSENENDASGKIIYRIKDDITDWDGNPLFPPREIRPSTYVDVDESYKEWLNNIHQLFSEDSENRALAWRRAQALQWSASSPDAGVAYLVRYALRSGLTMASLDGLTEAVTALRPYRGGSPDEEPEALQARMLKQTGGVSEDAEPPASLTLLSQILKNGAALLARGAVLDKLHHVIGWLTEAPDEKLVLFAQPIETVYSIRESLRQHFGHDCVSLIVGGQDRNERKQEIEKFWDPNGPRRVLVSSSAGGEGINLQVSRRLVHFDVPWNPMNLEQRVGRVHRYGSTEKIIVDTLVLQNSREQRVLARCQARLGSIARDLNLDKLDDIYARTMSRIPYDELSALMDGESFGPISPEETERIDKVVTAGFDSWQSADEKFRAERIQLEEIERGYTDNDDLRCLLLRTGALRQQGWKRRILGSNEDGSTQLHEEEAEAYRLKNGELGYVGRDAGVGLIDDIGQSQRIPRLGLNTASVADSLRKWIDETSDGITGVSSVLIGTDFWSEACTRYTLTDAFKAGGLLLAYYCRHLDLTSSKQREISSELVVKLATRDGTITKNVPSSLLAALVRELREARPKRNLPPEVNSEALLTLDDHILQELRTVAPGQPIRVVFPLAAIWLEPAS